MTVTAGLQSASPPATSSHPIFIQAGSRAPSVTGSQAAPPAQVHRAAGSGSRSSATDVLHAVPDTDTTRSAVCGARIRTPKASWDMSSPRSCPDCVAALTPPLPAGAYSTADPVSVA